MKQKKRIIALIMAALLAASVVGTSVAFIPSGTGIVAEAAEAPAGDFEYTANEDGTITITKYIGSSGDVEIPSKIDNKPVTSIGSNAFYFCTGLTSITIPDSVTSIGDEVFLYCISLTSINVDENNPSYSSVDGILYNKAKTEMIDVPYALNGDIAIPNGITTIRDDAFSYRTSITSISIPDSVTSIGNSAFSYCSGLTRIEIPDSVTSIGELAFSCCTALNSINVDSDNPNYASIDGILFNKNKTELIACPNGIQGYYTIPDNVTSIGNSAFQDCNGLTGVTISSSISTIGENAFYNCTGLGSINVDENNQYYSSKDGILYNKQKSEIILVPLAISGDISIADGITTIEEGKFFNRAGITNITIPNSVTSIGRDAFCYCSGLTSIIIPDSVTNISFNAFSYCSGLSNIKIGSGVKSIAGGVFIYTAYYNNSDNWDAGGVLYIDNCFIEMDKNHRGSYDIKEGTRLIADRACWARTGLTSITIPDSVTSIGEYSFYHCTGLTSIEIPDKVTSIGLSAFEDCKGLTRMVIGNGVKSIGEYMLANCSTVKLNLYYHGNEDEWKKITIGENNDELDNVKKEFNYHPNDGEYQSDNSNHWLVCEFGGEKLNEARHIWNGGKVTKAPTCTAEGVKTYTCTVCNHTKTETIAATGHKWNAGVITKQPTYTATGVKTFTCNACKQTKTQSIAKKVLAKVTVSSAANSATGITIKWNNAGNDVSGYKIYRKIGNGGYKLIKTVNNKTFSYNDTGVKNSNGYTCTYAVRAYYGSLQGSYAAKSYVRLTRPTITSATNPASRRLTVKWGRNNKATGYQIMYKTGTTTKYVTVKGWSNYYRNINSLVKGKTYYVYVRSYKTVGKTNYYSAWSPYKTVRIAK